MHYGRLLGAGALAGLLVACSATGEQSLPPQPNAPAIQQSPTQQQPLASTLNTQASSITTYQSWEGTVAGLRTGGGFVLNAGSTMGKVDVLFTSSTHVNTYAARLATNMYAIVLGTGSTATSISAVYVALYPTAPTTVSVSGTVTGTAGTGFDVKTSTFGTVPVLIDTHSGLTSYPPVGSTVTVNGIGSTSSAVLARSTSGSGATPTPQPPSGGSISQTHVLTADYLGTPYGTTQISATQARPYLTWAQTGIENATAFHDSGLKTQVYFDPNRAQSNDPLYSSAKGAIAHTCTSGNVTDTFAGITQYVMAPASSTLQSAYRTLVEQKVAQGHIDAIFEDNAGPLSGYGTTSFKASLPCSYSDSAWLSGGKTLEASVPVPTIFNGLSGLNGHNVSLSIGLLSNASTIGGNLEHCFTEDGNPEQGAWLWQAIENTQLQVVAKGKYFQCEARNLAQANESAAARIYTIASFLLTYDPNHSILWEQFATPSGFNVMPESQLVPLDPLVTAPSSVTSLQSSAGPFVREYRACYYAGKPIGACAMVVNSDYSSHSFPSLRQSYHHTMVVTGSGVLDGGTATFGGSMPGSTIANQTAYVLSQ